MTQRLSAGKVVFTLIGAALAFYVVDRASGYVRAQYVASGSPQAWISDASNWTVQFPAVLLRSLFQLSAHRIDVIAGGIAAGLVLLIALYVWSNKQNKRPGQEHGSARWGRPREIKPFLDRRPSHELRFTRSEALSLDTRKTQRNLNVLVLGASGSGKTRSYVMPNLRKIDASTAVTDPKGEILAACGPDLEARGIQVRTLNLIDLKKSGHFNPFRYLNPDEPETGIAQLVECIIANTKGADHQKGDEFWDRAERALLMALTAYEWATTVDDSETEASLVGVLDLQKDMQGSEVNKDARESPTDLKFAAAREVIDEWRAGSLDAPDATVMQVLEFACRQYRNYEQGPTETRMSVVISLGVRLAPLDMNDVREILRRDNLSIDQLGYQPTALFLEIPDTHATFKFVAAMFWQSLFAQLIYRADHEQSGHLPRPVHAFLDEFANIGVIPAFQRLIATIRSRGISASIVVQSHSQGKAMFRDEWDGIVNNCDTKLFLGGDDVETTKWLSQVLGEETIVADETSKTHGPNGSWSTSQRKVARALMKPDEIGTLDGSLAIVKIRGLHPFKSKKLAA